VNTGEASVETVAGYMHPAYAESLAEFGQPRFLPRCGGWILERPIAGSVDRDGMGCYPLFACRDWKELDTDLEKIGSDLVSLALVTDPFGEYDEELLQSCFGDLVYPFKEHYVVDLEQPLTSHISTHHKRYARKALREVQVETVHDPRVLLEEWVGLYSQLIRKHNIQGFATFSRLAFTKQLQIPGIVAFRAVHENETVGILLWYAQGRVGYYHLGAFSNIGYKVHASFALFWCAIDHFSSGGTMRWLDLGAGAGVMRDRTDGLSRFKQGWSSGIRTAFFCGRIFDPITYSELAPGGQNPSTSYFPAYRLGEFR
jgi:hypothetical protein